MARFPAKFFTTSCVALFASANLVLGAPAAGGSLAITLRGGGAALIANGGLSLRMNDGKFVPAPAGRYVTQDGKPLVVGSGGRLDAKTSALLKSSPPKSDPSAKPTAATQNIATKGAAPAPRSASDRAAASGGGAVKIGSHF